MLGRLLSHTNDHCTPRLQFSDRGERVAPGLVMRREHDARRARLDQREGSVLELATCKALDVYVRNLFHLERGLQSDGQ